MNGSLVADQDTSFQALDKMLLRDIDIVKGDPGVAEALGFTGGANTARMFISLKPLEKIGRRSRRTRSSRGCVPNWLRFPAEP